MSTKTDVRFNRFKDAEWFGENKVILIGGTGGTGSWLSLYLSRTGNHELHLFDNDVFERHNMAGQFVRSAQVGDSKVRAVADNLELFSDVRHNIFTYNQLYTDETMSNEIVFSCFDNLKARRDMFTSWKKQVEVAENPEDYLYVDLRLLAETLTIFVVQGHKPDQIKDYYENQLPDDNEVPDADCTLKQTSHAAAMIAATAVGYFTNWVANRKEKADYRIIPYRHDYMVPINMTTDVYL